MGDSDPFVDHPNPDRLDANEGIKLLEAARGRVRDSPWMRGVDFDAEHHDFQPSSSAPPEIAPSGLAPPDRDNATAVPGCSNQEGGALRVSNSMLKTYIAMRGTHVGFNDSLFEWINDKERAGRHNNDGEPSLIRDIDRSICYRESLKDTPRERQEVFLYDRPHGDHIQAPVGHNMELHKLSVKERDEGWHKKARAADGIPLRDYVSDDEGDPADARISPCTFLEFSDGARRWDADQPEKPEPEDIPLRPTTPDNRPHVHKERVLRYQRDEEDGKTLSAEGNYDSISSMLFTPPGVSPGMAGYLNRLYLYDRMNANAAPAIQGRLAAPANPFNASAPSGNEYYREDEVKEVISREWKIDPAVVQRNLETKWAEVKENKTEEDRMNGYIERFRHENYQLRPDNEKLHDCLAVHRYQQQRKESRARRIQQHVYQQMQEVDAELEHSKQTLDLAVRTYERIDRENSELLYERDVLLREFGKETPQEVFDMFPDLFKH